MKWRGRRRSSNIDDRRGQSSPGRGLGGFNPMLLGPLIKLLFSKTGLVIVGIFLVVSFATGNNPLNILGQFFTGGAPLTESSTPYRGSEKENELAELLAQYKGREGSSYDCVIPVVGTRFTDTAILANACTTIFKHKPIASIAPKVVGHLVTIRVHLKSNHEYKPSIVIPPISPYSSTMMA